MGKYDLLCGASLTPEYKMQLFEREFTQEELREQKKIRIKETMIDICWAAFDCIRFILMIASAITLVKIFG